MIVHKTFSGIQLGDFTERLDKREKLRQEAEEFIASRINEEALGPT